MPSAILAAGRQDQFLEQALVRKLKNGEILS